MITQRVLITCSGSSMLDEAMVIDSLQKIRCLKVRSLLWRNCCVMLHEIHRYRLSTELAKTVHPGEMEHIYIRVLSFSW